MPAERVSMRRVREILRYRFEQELGYKAISLRVGAVPSTVRATLKRAADAGLSWPLDDALSDAALEASLYRDAGKKTGHRRCPEPDWAQLHRELKRKHVTLQVLWDEYIAEHPDGYRYSRFCDLYRSWAMKLPVTMRQNHAPGEKLFVDYAGDKIGIVVDRLTGEIRDAHIFVAVLGASSLTYAEGSWTETLPDWLTYEQGLSVRAVSERLKLSKTTVSTYLLRARQAGLTVWPLPPGYDDDAAVERLVFRRVGRPAQDREEPDWPLVAREIKRKGVTLVLLWQEYRAAHPNGYGYTWFCDRFLSFQRRTHVSFRNRHEAGAVMQTDYAGQTVPLIDPVTCVITPAQIFVAVLGASSFTFAMASLSQQLPDWIDAQCRALSFIGGVPRAIVCDNLKSGVVKALWFEPTLSATFAAMAEHYDTTILPTRSRRPRDKGKVEGAVLIVERWILARLRNRRFFSLADLNAAIADLLVDLNDRPMRHVGKSRRAIFEEIERTALAALPTSVFEYAEWKTARVHPDYHIEADKTFYSVPHRLIGRQVDVRLTHRVVEIFYDHVRVASHMRTSQRRGHVTVNEHMPKSHQRYANISPASLIERARKTGPNTAMFVERLMVDKPHPEQGYRSAMGILSLARRYEHDRLEAACDRALVIGAVTYSSVNAILKAGLDKIQPTTGPLKPTPAHGNIRGGSYYQ